MAPRLTIPGWGPALALVAVVALAAIHAWQQRWLCDDAFISFRYSRQLEEGYGLVFNRGERVEGYTNFLWVLEMALGMKLGIEPELASVVLGGLASVSLGALVAWMMCTSPLARTWWPAVFALLLLALNRSVAVWATSGLETRQFTLFCVMGVALTGAALERLSAPFSKSDSPWWRRARVELGASLSLALAEATRPEGALVFASVIGAYALLGPARRWLATRFEAPDAGATAAWREGVVRLAALVSPFVILVATHYVFRRVYYGDWLPNTYYAKHVRPWTESGNLFFAAAILEHGVYLLLPLAVVGALARWRRGSAVHVVSFAVLVPHMLYVRRIGGDHFEYRPLDLHWPLLTVAAIDGLLAIAEAPRFARMIKMPWPSSRPAVRFGRVLAGVMFVALAEYSTVLQRAYEHESSSLTTRASTYKLRGHLTKASTFELPWVLPQVALAAYNAASSYCVDHQSCARQGEHKAYWNLLEREYGAYRSLSREEAGTLPTDATWAREAVGVAPYMFPGVTVIDEYGLTDHTIARTPVDTPNERRTMAHDRRPPPGYLQSRGVNIEIGPASRTQGEALRYAYWAVRVRDDMWIPFLAYSGDWVVSRFAGKPIFSQFAYDTERPAENFGWIEGQYSRGVRFVGRFDTPALDGWSQVDGPPLSPFETAGLPDDLGHVGKSYLSTYDPQLGDRAKVRFVSPSFIARGHLVFLMAGGAKHGTEVRLVVDGGITKTWSGRGARVFELYSGDLRPFEGKSAALELLDDSDEASVALDHVLLVEPVPTL